MKYLSIITAAVGAVVTLGIMSSAASASESASDLLVTLAFYVWAALPFLVLISLALFIFGRRSRAAETAMLFTTILVTVTSVWIYYTSIYDSTSSTSALAFLFVPAYALAATAIIFGVSWLTLCSIMSVSKT
jgi:hypothetical protein